MSPLVMPPFAALANDGISASSADAPTRAPAPVAAVLVRNCLRSVRPAVLSCSSNMCVNSLQEWGRCHASIRGGRGVGSPPDDGANVPDPAGERIGWDLRPDNVPRDGL